jgi:hypothetical protein
MKVLLFLSAILSALTGAISGVRAADVPAHQTALESAYVQVAAPKAAFRAARRPEAVLPALTSLAEAPRVLPVAVAPVAPLYAGRRRE